MSNLPKIHKYILAVAIQVAVILLVVLYKMVVAQTGTTVLLELKQVLSTETAKPTSLTLEYGISEVKTFEQNISNGDTVYVPLYKSGNYWTAGYATKSLNGTIGDCLDFCEYNNYNDYYSYIKGQVISGGEMGYQSQLMGGMERVPYNDYQNRTIKVKYGIEDYKINSTIPATELTQGSNYARVLIDQNGKAALKKVYINNKALP